MNRFFHAAGPRTLFATASLIAAFLTTAPLEAEIVLDDFTQPSSTSSPAQLSEVVESTDIGPLLATRELRIAATASGERSPRATLDIAGGVMQADLDFRGATMAGNPALFAFQFNYAFTPTDVSEGGMNDAILIDFNFTRGNQSPSSLGLIVFDDTNTGDSYFVELIDLPLLNKPFTAILPFDEFTTRGGSPGLPDFTTLDVMRFDFFYNLPRVPESMWEAEITQIRFGRIVPEPATWLIGGLISLLLLICRQRHYSRKGVCDDYFQPASPDRLNNLRGTLLRKSRCD